MQEECCKTNVFFILIQLLIEYKSSDRADLLLRLGLTAVQDSTNAYGYKNTTAADYWGRGCWSISEWAFWKWRMEGSVHLQNISFTKVLTYYHSPVLPIHWGAEQQANLWKVSGLKSLQKFWVWNFIPLGGDFGCSKFPSWLAAFAPLNSMFIEEKAWNAYPKCKTGWSLSWPFYVGTRFSSTIFSLPENVVFLTQEVVAHDTGQGFSTVGLVSSITIHNMWHLLWHILY